jgi:hypothetical protein
MATLIVVYNSEGVVGRCDQRCYGAKRGSPCDCCCGGVNHAVGLTQAAANTGVAFEKAAEFAKRKAELGSGAYSIAMQASLDFPMVGQ